eukprot:TRINITY_DN3068_c0_g1_i1.p1 TRINITY_DN3068_c0_g1~~TRINITY_DN3068_c0_g1_i1.p1  ORF type:complete len:134 (-),score=21.76 TRINITY_DN3068_c0_g1_i1:81-482(-)
MEEIKVETPTVSDLRIIPPQNFQLSDSKFTLKALDGTFDFAVEKQVKDQGNLVEYRSLEDKLTLTVVNAQEGTVMGSFWNNEEMYLVQALSSHRRDIQDAGINVDPSYKQVVFKDSDTRLPDGVNCGALHPNQ